MALSSINPELFRQQFLWVLMGVLVFWASFHFDWRGFLNHQGLIWAFYVFTILLLVITYFTAPVIRNTRSWLVIGPVQFQPVELVKIAMVLVYASYFSRRHLGIARFKYIAVSFALFILPALFVMLQPDMGSVTVLFGIWVGFLLVSGLPKRYVAIGLLTFAIFFVLGWNFFLQDYQKDRISGVFYPERDVLGVNYSVAQSKIAVGSAGFFGKGYKQGTQTQLGFLTEPATDFIFPALVEEWGLVAGITVIAAFLALVFKILKIGIIAGQNFEKFVCVGTTIILGWQFFVNAGSALGLTPVIGLPFPFLSYGGSSVLTSFFLLSIINSIAYGQS